MAGREQTPLAGTKPEGFDITSVDIGLLVESGGEPLRQWFVRFIDWVVASVGTIATQKGLEVGRKHYEDAGKQIAKFLERVPALDKDFLEAVYAEKMRAVNLRYGMNAIMHVPVRGGTEKSLYLDRQPSRYEVAADAVRIGGGKIARYSGAD